MLKIGVILLLLLWIWAVFTRHTMGGFVHVLLVLAIILALIVLVRGENP